jgi:hypothetical protein
MFTATKEQIDAWKTRHGKVFRVTIEEADKSCYLKPPTRKALSYATMAGKESPLKCNEILLKDCWLDGDEEIKTDDGLFLSVSPKLAELIQTKETELEEL